MFVAFLNELHLSPFHAVLNSVMIKLVDLHGALRDSHVQVTEDMVWSLLRAVVLEGVPHTHRLLSFLPHLLIEEA